MILKVVQQMKTTIGSERLIEFSNGSKVKQKLEKLDDNKMMIGWRIIETDNKMLPVNSYAAKVFVKKIMMTILQQLTTKLVFTGDLWGMIHLKN